MAALSSNANVAHNLSVLQSQLLALQHENAALTREMAVKDQHVALREQQLRVMQQRMADVESAVATWKDKYLEQLHLVRALQAGAATSDAPRASPEPATSREAAHWLPMPRPAAPSPSPPTGDLLASVIEQLSPSDREKLQALLATARPEAAAAAVSSVGDSDATSPAAAAWEQVFEEAPHELLQLLHCYLLPTLESAAQGEKATSRRTFRCLTRTFHRVVTDVLVVCDVAESAEHEGVAVASSPTECSIDSETLASPVSSASLSEFQEPRTSSDESPRDDSKPSASSNPQQQQQQHLFDYIESRGAVPIPHGPREIHPTKAVYISSASVAASSASRRLSTMAPSSSNTSTSAASRHATSSSRAEYDDAGGGSSGNGDRRSGGLSLTGSAPSSREGSGKIKKMFGMMKGLNRPKTSSSSSSSTSTSTSIVGTPPALLLPSPVTTPELDREREREREDATCDGCGRNVANGSKWVCRTCRAAHGQRFALCDKCYGQGLHGKEHELALFERIEEIVVAKCPKLVHEQALMRLLRVGICKGNLKKYSFCLTWIADLLLCKHLRDLRARALEISQISPHVRSEFVRLLTELLGKHRRDIELLTEWQPAQNVAATTTTSNDPSNNTCSTTTTSSSSSSSSTGAGAGAGVGSDAAVVGSGLLPLDTLRIWVKDHSAAITDVN